jgi:hypothetical protein
MDGQPDLRDIGKFSNDTTKAVLETFQAARRSPEWPRSVTHGLSRVWRGVENQNFVDDLWHALEQVGRSAEVVAWAFSDANDDLLGAAILAAWAFQRSGSRRVTQDVTRGVQAMQPALRSTFTALYRAYLEKAAWKLSGAGPWACHPDDPTREHKEQEEQRATNRRFCETIDLEALVGSSPVLVSASANPVNEDTQDIFISYRRDGGEHLAARVKDALKARGFSVFMDIEDLKSGKFNEALFQKIEAATDFLVILTPGCLERCRDEEDWLRKEMRYAIERKRNIVPILARGFQMPPPQTLPAEIAELPNYNGLAPAHELFEASVDRLVSKFLKAPRKCGATPSGVHSDAVPASERSDDFSTLFAERPDVIAEIEEEALRVPAQTTAEFEKLIVRLEIAACKLVPPTSLLASTTEHNRRKRLALLIEQYDPELAEAVAFAAASGLKNDPVEFPFTHGHNPVFTQWRESLEHYRQTVGSAFDISRSILSLGSAVFPLVCLSFRSSDSDGSFTTAGEHYDVTWRMDVELAQLMSRLRDLRALPFLAQAIVRHADSVNGKNDWSTGILRAVSSFGAGRATVDACLERLVGVTLTEILRERQERTSHP